LSEAIEAARAKLEFAVWAYVFMPDHAHLIVCPRQRVYKVGAILRAIKEPVGRRGVAYLMRNAPEWIPRITQSRSGREEHHFWQPGRGFDRNIVEPKTLTAMIEYIHLNPVRRGLVDRARDWRWSSAGWYEGRDRNDLVPDPIPPEWLDC
jgi:putative transposase